MKLVIGDFEVEVKAKRKGTDRNNVLDTMFFLNNASMAYTAAYLQFKSEGHPYMAEEFRKMGDDIYSMLDKAGAYKDR